MIFTVVFVFPYLFSLLIITKRILGLSAALTAQIYYNPAKQSIFVLTVGL